MRRFLPVLLIAVLIAFASGCSLKSGSSTGSLFVASEAVEKVYVDGVERGITNQEIPGIEPGKHVVSVGSADENQFTQAIVVTDGEDVTINVSDSAEGISDRYIAEETAEFDENSLLDDSVLTGEEVNPAETEGQARSSLSYSVTADFAARDALPQTTVPKSQWYKYGTYGPPAATFKAPVIPKGFDPVEWKRERIVAVAKKYLNLRYVHKHIPALGLDCSNYTAWVYNYGLGIKFTSAVSTQGATVGRRLSSGTKLQKGDLLYFKVDGKIGHVGIYIGNNYMIDESTMNKYGVAIKRFDQGWPKSHFAYARRVI